MIFLKPNFAFLLLGEGGRPPSLTRQGDAHHVYVASLWVFANHNVTDVSARHTAALPERVQEMTLMASHHFARLVRNESSRCRRNVTLQNKMDFACQKKRRA